MKCPSCEADVASGSKFCPNCGTSISSGKEAPPRSADEQAVQRLAKSQTAEDDYDPEDDLWTGGYSGKAMIGSWITAAIVTIAGLVALPLLPLSQTGLKWLAFGILLLILWGWLGVTLAYRKLSVRYELTSQRFIHRRGILTQTTDRIEVIDMDDVTFQQGIVQRLFGVGTIQITSSDRSHPELVMKGIADVRRIAGLIDDVRRKERRRRGIHIEAI